MVAPNFKPPKRQRNRAHMALVARLGCWCCRKLGKFGVPAEVHHILEGRTPGRRSSDEETVPLCPYHHREGGAGEAVHAGAMSWRLRWGSERDMLSDVMDELAMRHPGYDPKQAERFL